MILEVLFLAGAVYWLARAIGKTAGRSSGSAVTAAPASPQLEQLLKYAGRLFAERQYLAAEKAYLKVLKLSHKDKLAYARLGMIYMALKNYPDAIECLQIAAQLAPSAAAYYNLGLAYYENRNYIKAIAMTEKSIMFEPTALRYNGLAKAYAKVSDQSKVVATLEKAVALERNKKNLTLLAEAYAAQHERQRAEETYRQILELDPTDAKALRMAGTQPATD